MSDQSTENDRLRCWCGQVLGLDGRCAVHGEFKAPQSQGMATAAPSADVPDWVVGGGLANSAESRHVQAIIRCRKCGLLHIEPENPSVCFPLACGHTEIPERLIALSQAVDMVENHWRDAYERSHGWAVFWCLVWASTALAAIWGWGR